MRVAECEHCEFASHKKDYRYRVMVPLDPNDHISSHPAVVCHSRIILDTNGSVVFGLEAHGVDKFSSALEEGIHIGDR